MFSDHAWGGVASSARITVIIPCFNDGPLIGEAVDSIREPEPVEIVIVDDCSTDPATLACYPELEARGCRLLRHATNLGSGAARNTGLAAASTPYVFNLDADDLLLPGVLSQMASLLDADPEADAAYGDYEEFGASQGVRRTVPVLDPYRVAYVNKFPGIAMFRRETLERVGGWPTDGGYEDWALWMTLAERGIKVLHTGSVVFRYRTDPNRNFGRDRRDHASVYRHLRDHHPNLFANLRAHRGRSSLPWFWKHAYPLLYVGGRPRFERTRRIVRHLIPTWSPALRQGVGVRRTTWPRHQRLRQQRKPPNDAWKLPEKFNQPPSPKEN